MPEVRPAAEPADCYDERHKKRFFNPSRLFDGEASGVLCMLPDRVTFAARDRVSEFLRGDLTFDREGFHSGRLDRDFHFALFDSASGEPVDARARFSSWLERTAPKTTMHSGQ